jgi:hypothetical protein
LALGHWFESVHAGPEGGAVEYHAEYWQRIPRTAHSEERAILIRENLMTVYAGTVAESIKYGKPLELPDAGEGSDRDQIVDLLVDHSPQTVDSYREGLVEEVTFLLGCYWLAVEAVASALLEHSRLSYAQVREIYAQAT